MRKVKYLFNILHNNMNPAPDKTGRNKLYKEILADFNNAQMVRGELILANGLCNYFVIRGYDIHDFPEIVKHKPKDNDAATHGGYWFHPDGFSQIQLRRNILIWAIEETNDESSTRLTATTANNNGLVEPCIANKVRTEDEVEAKIDDMADWDNYTSREGIIKQLTSFYHWLYFKKESAE